MARIRTSTRSETPLLEPPKTSFRSEPTDFQRGEVEIDGHNLYFDEWEYKFDAKTTPLADK